MSKTRNQSFSKRIAGKNSKTPVTAPNSAVYTKVESYLERKQKDSLRAWFKANTIKIKGYAIRIKNRIIVNSDMFCLVCKKPLFRNNKRQIVYYCSKYCRSMRNHIRKVKAA